MTSKKKLKYLTNLLFEKLEDTDIDLTSEESDNVVNFNKDIRKDLDNITKLYNIIKEKRNYARLERDRHAREQDISNEEKSEIYAEICTYNDVLSLMESMFEVKDAK